MKGLEQITEKLPKITEKNKNYVFGGMLLAIFLFDYFVIMSPQLRALTELNSKITVLKRDIKDTNENIGKIDSYRVQVAGLKDEMKVLGNKIILKKELPTVLKRISRIANETEVRINQIMPLKDMETSVLSNDDGSYYSLPLLVNARGGYHNIGRFFNRIERDEVFMSITDFDVAANSDDSQHHTLKATIKAFFLEKKEEEKK